jgi:hypothetical protein
MGSKYVVDVDVYPFKFPGSILPGKPGADFDKHTVVIKIFLGDDNEVPIKEIRLTNPETNVQNYFVTLFDEEHNKIATYEHQNGIESLFIEEADLVAEIKIRITKTCDGMPPRAVAFSILADIDCEESTTSTTARGLSTISTPGNFFLI